ncbi:MAG: hypothetical protein NTW25_13690 [Candidatus Kapabacteria bacterium]|nr:hypothetical protein [Candidatus Kapabacteria bacterium]
MNKVKLLTILAIGLLITNIALVAFVFFRDNEGPRPDKKKVIIENMKFDETQIKEYERLVQLHRRGINEADKEIRELKTELYYTLSNNADQRTKDSLFLELSIIQNKIEHIHYTHFQAIRNLCRPDQKTLFENFTKELVKLFGPPPKREKNRDKERNDK